MLLHSRETFLTFTSYVYSAAIVERVVEVIPVVVRIRTCVMGEEKMVGRGGRDESSRVSRRETKRRDDPIELRLLVEG